MKKFVALTLALVMAAALAACGSVSTPATDTGKYAGLDYYEFTLSMHDPSESNNGLFYDAWAKRIEELTEGHVKIEIHYSGQLASAEDVLEMVESGGVDIGWIFTSFYAGQFPLTDITQFPFIGFGEAVPTTETLWDLYEEFPELQEEWNGAKLLFLYGNPRNIFASVRGPVDSPDSVNDLVMRTPAGPIIDLVNAMGGRPVVMEPGDMSEAIRKNVISGFVFEPAGITNFSLQEAAKMYYTDYAMYDAAFALIMNWDKWNSLPEEFQNIIEENSGRQGSVLAAEDFQAAADNAEKIITDAGNEWVSLTDEQVAAFEAAAAPVIDSWIGKYTTGDFDYRAYFDRAVELLKKYK